MRYMTRTRAAAAVTALGLILGLSLVGAVPASAGPLGPTDDSVSETDEARTAAETRTDSILVQPDSGSPAEDPGDRGGAYQGALFVAILAGVGGVGLLAWRDMRRHRPA